MPFPLSVAGRSFASGPGLAIAVVEDARAGGGTVVPGAAPSRWVMDLVRSGQLEADIAVALSAALVRTPQPAAIAEGARLAAGLREPRLAQLLQAAIAGHDVGLLLHADPLVAGQSVEDGLLRAWAAVAALDAAEARTELLQHLRNAGLSGVETMVLATHGTPAEIRQWLPAVFAEGTPPDAGASLGAGLLRGGDPTLAILEVIDRLDPEQRAALGEEILTAAPALQQIRGARERLVG